MRASSRGGSTCRIYFDGACPGIDITGLIAYGYRFVEQGTIKRVLSSVGGHRWINPPPSTVSIAEYVALIEALKSALKWGFKDRPIVVHGDSKLVIEQTFGNWKIRGGVYVPWAMKAKKLVKKFSNIRGEWIPRESNHHCDHLAGTAWAKRGPERKRRLSLLTMSSSTKPGQPSGRSTKAL